MKRPLIVVLALVVVAATSCGLRPGRSAPAQNCYGTEADGVIQQAFNDYGIPDQIDHAEHIAYRESRCNMGVDVNPTGVSCGGSVSHARGLFQILVPCHAQAIYENCGGPWLPAEILADNPACNAATAAAMVRAGGWGPWGN